MNKLNKIKLNKKTKFIYESEVLSFIEKLGVNMRVVISKNEFDFQKRELKKALKFYIQSEI